MLHQVISDIIQFMKVVIFQSPLVQLNTPYPSGAYLKSFFLQQDIIKFSSVQWFDLSNLLYNNIFSKTGLSISWSQYSNLSGYFFAYSIKNLMFFVKILPRNQKMLAQLIVF